MKQMLLVLVTFSAVLSTGAIAGEFEGTCGDHWFKVDFHVDTVSLEGEMSFGGDSGEQGDYTVRYDAKDGSKNFTLLSVNGAPYVRVVYDSSSRIYTGFYSSNGTKAAESGLGFCQISVQ